MSRKSYTSRTLRPTLLLSTAGTVHVCLHGAGGEAPEDFTSQFLPKLRLRASSSVAQIRR